VDQKLALTTLTALMAVLFGSGMRWRYGLPGQPSLRLHAAC
jgi:hypothetical protein